MKITLSALYDQAQPLEFMYRYNELIDLFTVARELQFDGIDYCAPVFPDLFFNSERPIELSKKYNVPILGVHAPMHVFFYTPPLLFNRLVTMYSLFHDAEIFNVHLSGFITPLQKDARSIKKFFRLTEQRNIPLSIESNPKLAGLQYYPKVTYDPEIFAEFCLANKFPITFDTAHVDHCNYDIVTFFKKYHKQIKLIHLSDSIGHIQHLPLGQGKLPIVQLLKALKTTSYNQMISFEINNFPKGATRDEKKKAIDASLKLVKRYAL